MSQDIDSISNSMTKQEEQTMGQNSEEMQQSGQQNNMQKSGYDD